MMTDEACSLTTGALKLMQHCLPVFHAQLLWDFIKITIKIMTTYFIDPLGTPALDDDASMGFRCPDQGDPDM